MDLFGYDAGVLVPVCTVLVECQVRSDQVRSGERMTRGLVLIDV